MGVGSLHNGKSYSLSDLSTNPKDHLRVFDAIREAKGELSI